MNEHQLLQVFLKIKQAELLLQVERICDKISRMCIAPSTATKKFDIKSLTSRA